MCAGVSGGSSKKDFPSSVELSEEWLKVGMKHSIAQGGIKVLVLPSCSFKEREAPVSHSNIVAC